LLLHLLLVNLLTLTGKLTLLLQLRKPKTIARLNATKLR
jgi:hypothetical protein